MTPSQRLFLNTAATYTRSVFAVGLGLFSSRWVLSALGQTDFGLFTVVGSLILFVTFLNNVMAVSASRHFAYAIGQGDSTEVNKWFNAALSTHFLLPVFLIIIGWPVGEYFIRNILTIPPERLVACVWVFRLSLISAFISMASVPFVAMFRAKQKIVEVAIWETSQAVFAFTLAFILALTTGDRLIFFAVGMVAISVVIQLGQVGRAFFVFHECRVKFGYWFDATRFKEIFGFASWSFVGMSGGLLRNQGSAILLNLYFGPSVNAAYGIANQVSSQTSNLSTAMIGAFSPEIIASEGNGNRSRVLDLSLRVNKFGTLLIILFAVPLIVEMDYVLQLWLREPPLYTALLCQLMLCTFLLDRLSIGYELAVNAHGKIAAYQATVGATFFLTLPLAWLFIHLGYSPTSVGMAFIVIQIVATLGRVFWMRHLFGVPVRRWFIAIVLPCSLVVIISVISSLIPGWLMPPSLWRLFIVGVVSVITSTLAAWHFSLDLQERAFIMDNIFKVIRKFQTKKC